MRMATLRNAPVIVTTEKARLETMVRERERSNRIILEFGADSAVNSGDKTEMTVFVRVVESADGTSIFHGAQAPAVHLERDVIDHVTLNPAPSRPAPVRGEKGYLEEPNSAALG